MPTSKAAGAKKPAAKPLPSVKFAKAKFITATLEQLLRSNTDLFIAAGQDFREQHRAGTTRPLSAYEVAQLAAGLGVTLSDAKTQIEDADLVSYDEPDPLHLLLAAGVATSSAWINGLSQLVALVEMDDETFRAAAQHGEGMLEVRVNEAVAALDDLDLSEVRARARAAVEHLAEQMDVEPGKAWAVLARSVWDALQQAAAHLRTIPTSSELTSSPASTAGVAA